MTASPGSASEPLRDEVLLAFLERFMADQLAGRTGQLADYLRIWPEHQVAIAAEFLAATRTARADEPAGGIGEPTAIGPYRIDKEIGRGGQGSVYLAWDTRLQRKVALKVIPRLGAGAMSQLRRFRREAEVASRLDIPGICGVHDFGIEDGVPYIAMPFLEGETLAARLARLRRDEPRLANGKTVLGHDELTAMLVLFERAARALHRAHDAGILHRDIKPANIMITPPGEPVIFDFGLAGSIEPDDGESLTQSGDVFGSPSYMSPEQIAVGRGRVDRRTDVYSLAVSLYESLTLRQPFEAPTREALFHAILTHAPTDPRRLNRSIPSDLCVVLDTAIEKERDRRYQTAAAFADDLCAVREQRPIEARRIGPAGRLLRWSRREPMKAVLLMALLVALPAIATLVTARIKDLPHVAAARRALVEEQRDALLAEATEELTENDPQAAARIFARALSLPGPAGEAAGGLVLAHLQANDPAAALRLLDQYHEQLGDGAAAFELRAEAVRALGRESDAAALERDAPVPATAIDHQLLATRALHNCEAGDAAHFQLAFTHATSAILLAQRPHLLLYDLRLHAAGHLLARDAVLDMVDAVARHWPGSARAQYRCGWALKVLDDPALLDRAITHLRTAIELRPDHPAAYNILGNCFASQGRLDDAVQALQASIRLKPDRAGTHVNLARVLRVGGQIDRAMECCRRALALGGEDSRAQSLLGTCHEARGEPALAMTCYRESLRLSPNEPASRINLARLLLVHGVALDGEARVDDAIAAYRESLQLDDVAEAHNNLGTSLLKKRLAAEAEAEFRAAVAASPQLADGHCNLVISLCAQEKLEPALAAAVRAIDAAPGFGKAHAMLGHVLVGLQRFEEAVEPFRVAVQLDPGLVEAECDLGCALAVAGDLDEAIRVWQHVASDHPDIAFAWYQLGCALCELERIEAGADALRRVRDLAAAGQQVPPDLSEQIAAVEVRLAERRRIAAHIAGATDPETGDELLLHAFVARDEGHPELAVRWYGRIFERDDELLRNGPLHWQSAVTAAMRAAQGGRARSWLQAGTRTLRERHANAAITTAELRRALLPLTRSPDLLAVRAPESLAALPEPEREQWRELWREVEALLPPLRRFTDR